MAVTYNGGVLIGADTRTSSVRLFFSNVRVPILPIDLPINCSIFTTGAIVCAQEAQPTHACWPNMFETISKCTGSILN